MPKPRFLKSKNERLTDTLDYIQAKLSEVDSQEVEAKMQPLSEAQQSQLGAFLSLGATGTSTNRTANREVRRAKRALMLVTKLFLTNLPYLAEEIIRIKALPETSEANLLAELRSWFILPGVTPGMVADVAEENILLMPTWNNQNMNPTSVRGHWDTTFAKSFNCYNAIVYWAFQAGAISRRFLFNKLHGNDGNHFFPIFSTCGWVTKREYTPGVRLIPLTIEEQMATQEGKGPPPPPPTLSINTFANEAWVVPKGMAVYYVTPSKVFGHVALSLGDGRIISQNSVLPAYPGEIRDQDRLAVTQMQQAITHIISIKSFAAIHYSPMNNYWKIQHTATGFWEAFLPAER